MPNPAVDIKSDDLHALESSEPGKEFLTFSLAEEEYGVDILRVQEIRGWERVTRVPNSPGYMKGVLNIRGAIVPIVDLRQCFEMPVLEYTVTTVVIVLSVQCLGQDKVVGIVVDSVSDVVSAKLGELQNAPEFGDQVNTNFISGLASAEDKMIMLLDIEKLLCVAEETSQQKIEAC